MLDDIKWTLWAAADKLRANMDATEYKHQVLGLIFVKYISDTFAARRAELTRRFTNGNTLQQVLNLDVPGLLAANRQLHRLLVNGLPVEYQEDGDPRGGREFD
jgi:type I restriction-modification system DNA methylase subunit